MRKRKYKIFVADFETTVFKRQDHTEVWASGCVELNTENVVIHQSIDELFYYLSSMKSNVICYFHNLKFDGSFWLPFLMQKLNLKQAYEVIDEQGNVVRWLNEKEMVSNTFKYSISDMGQWYTITIKVGHYFIEIRDSLKLLPFAVSKIGESFKTKHKKLDMVYKGFRYSGCEITEEERKYIANDVLVVKEALEIMYQEGHSSLTIGSCCLEEYKKIISDDYDTFFPSMSQIILEENYGSLNVDEYIRRSYKGGWCYVVKGKEGKVKRNGTTFDVNSLYPSVMSSESGNRYPVGKPTFWTGNHIPDKAKGDNKYFFIRIRTRFYLKKDKLPFIQIKRSYLYKGNECLETSDVLAPDGKYYTAYKDKDGIIRQARPELTLTMTDFELLKDHYDLVDFEILDGCWFFAMVGIFDKYIEKYKQIKITSTGAVRELAKLFLNNLYGKMASSTDSNFKIAYIKENGVIGFKNIKDNSKKEGYIPVGSAITSYARNFTIRTAQQNYYGVGKRGFCYADTDSIHCDLDFHEVKGVNVHDTAFCHWSLECKWDEAIFTRQKTYIEHITHKMKNGEIVEVTPYYDIKCAGMPQTCKDIFEMALTEPTEEKIEELDEELRDYAKEFAESKKTLEDFRVGLTVRGKLLPKRISGGIVLLDSTYQMH